MDKKILVAYYSWSGNTKQVAEKINQQLPNSDLTEIKVAPDVFTSDMYETADIAKKQMSNNDYPQISTDITNFNDYDLILVGSPVWGAKPATPIYSFLQKLNGYKGKVASFYTDVGMAMGYNRTFKKWAKEANLDVLSSGHADKKLDAWISALN